MASKNEQASLATKGRNVSTSVASKESVGVMTHSKAKTVTMLQHATSKLVLLKEQGERQRREPVISLTSLGEPKLKFAPVHADNKNITSFTMKRNLTDIISRGKMNATRHITPVAFPPKSHEGHRKNQPAINFVTQVKGYCCHGASI
ncbi:hypothetical protein DVH24_002063 [Malus domestica]|uniref:Uncharacterized protein n=1 Tax=Malus domestica TaxID=3750 RepID=A0A498I918_MALDO|nr:hypothetical protein DVH24_002063 [Malus domestica]